ncbi:MAG: S8 family serine peptidase [Bacteroidota bacterium]
MKYNTMYRLSFILGFFFLQIIPLNGFSQEVNKYWVFFKNKPDTVFDPFHYFDKNTIARRVRNHLPLYDWYDLPVSNEYLSIVQKNCSKLKTHSRWFNAAVILATDSQISIINQFAFIDTIEQANPLTLQIADFTEFENKLELNKISDDLILDSQTKRMGADLLIEKGLTGKGIRIAIFDVGFSGADKHTAFQHIRSRNGILKTWDFVKNEENVWKGGWHGTAVWSCIAGKLNGRWSGLATDAEFLLARTEIGNKEPFAEEEYWVSAAEWADKNGADIINSSLGYTDSRYFPRQMDGKTTFITRGANLAAKKGMLVVNAAGNEGDSNWRIVAAPADADSVLTIGGVEPCCDYHISFSSYGPTRDMRIKPNVCAQGRAFCAKENGESNADGTSFASPLAAGFAACAWQAKRSLSNMQLFDELQKCASLFPYFDYAHGYGVLSADRFLNNIVATPSFVAKKASTTSETGDSTEYIQIEVDDKFTTTNPEGMDYLMYYCIVNTSGGLDSYTVIKVHEKIPVQFKTNAYSTGTKLRISLQGYMSEIQFK